MRNTQSFLKQLISHDKQAKKIRNSESIDDLALLAHNSETHREVDAKLHAFDDLQLIQKHSTRIDINENLDVGFGMRTNSVFKHLTQDNSNLDFEEPMEKRKGLTSHHTAQGIELTILTV